MSPPERGRRSAALEHRNGGVSSFGEQIAKSGLQRARFSATSKCGATVIMFPIQTLAPFASKDLVNDRARLARRNLIRMLGLVTHLH